MYYSVTWEHLLSLFGLLSHISSDSIRRRVWGVRDGTDDNSISHTCELGCLIFVSSARIEYDILLGIQFSLLRILPIRIQHIGTINRPRSMRMLLWSKDLCLLFRPLLLLPSTRDTVRSEQMECIEPKVFARHAYIDVWRVYMLVYLSRGPMLSNSSSRRRSSGIARARGHQRQQRHRMFGVFLLFRYVSLTLYLLSFACVVGRCACARVCSLVQNTRNFQ